MWYAAKNRHGETVATHRTYRELKALILALGRTDLRIEERWDNGEGDSWEK